MRIVSNDSLVVDSSETEPILSQIAIVEESEETSPSTEITASEDCLETVGDLPSVGVDGIQYLSHAELSQCRICLDNEGEDLIAPCHCKGTQKYVHRSCLDNWRSTKEGFAFAHCTECRAKFILRANVPPDRWWLRLKFQFLVARDHAFIFLIVQLIVAFLGILVYKFYGEELREMFGYQEHPYGFYTMAEYTGGKRRIQFWRIRVELQCSKPERGKKEKVLAAFQLLVSLLSFALKKVKKAALLCHIQHKDIILLSGEGKRLAMN